MSFHQKALVTLCLLAVLGLYIFQIYNFWNYTNDDAFITYRYSRHLAEGNGPYYNPGQHVEGYTNFSLMLIMASIIRFLGPDVVLPAGKLVGLFFGLLSILFSYKLCCRLIAEKINSRVLTCLWGACAVGIVATSPDFAVNSTSGLETTLFSFSFMLAVYLATLEAIREKWNGSGLAFGLAFLTRPESVYLFPVFWFGQSLFFMLKNFSKGSNLSFADIFRSTLKQKMFRILLVNAATVSLVLLLHLLYRYAHYDGEFLPNTYWAKSGAFWMLSAWSYISEGTVFSVLCTVGVVLAMAGFIVSKVKPLYYIPLAAIVLAGSFIPFITGLDWMIGKRLIAPYLPLLAALTVSGFCLLFSRIPRLHDCAGLVVAAVLISIIWFQQSSIRKEYHDYISQRSYGYQTGHAALAEWMKDKLQEGDSIALMDIGIVGYRLINSEIIDISGLTDRFIAKAPGAFLRKLYDPKYILDKNPKFIILAITTPGVSYEPINPAAPFAFWTQIEQHIYRNPLFQKTYVHYQQAENDDPLWMKKIALRLGAERIFEHGYPDSRYFLAAFKSR